jgi:DNA-binding CsgD family transcriptional regulator
MTPGGTAQSASSELSIAALNQAAFRIADCRSLTALRAALFDQADTMVGKVAMGIYLFDRRQQLRYVSSRLAPQGFLDQYEREYHRSDTMLDCIISDRRTIDGFHFYGPGGWRRCANHEFLRGWGFFHNMGGAFIVDDRVVGALFAASAHDRRPFEEAHVKRLDLMCRAGSLALTAMRARERLRCELSSIAADDWCDFLTEDDDRLGDAGAFDGTSRLDGLPRRSREVAQLVCQGRPNKAIANQLGISVHTVKEHVHNLCRRFGAINRTDLAQRLLISS